MTTRDGYVGSYERRSQEDDPRGRAPRSDPDGWAPPQPTSRVTLTLGGALMLLLLVGGAGAAVDLLLGPNLDVGTLVLLSVGALLSTLLVRRSGLFMVAVAPPLAYLVLTVVALAVSGASFGLAGLATGVVFGFPTMVVATLVSVLVVALRQVTGR